MPPSLQKTILFTWIWSKRHPRAQPNGENLIMFSNKYDWRKTFKLSAGTRAHSVVISLFPFYAGASKILNHWTSHSLGLEIWGCVGGADEKREVWGLEIEVKYWWGGAVPQLTCYSFIFLRLHHLIHPHNTLVRYVLSYFASEEP